MATRALVEIPAHQVHELPLHLSRFHGCGMGQNFRLNYRTCCRGGAFMFFGTRLFGCSHALLQRLVWMLNEDVIPVIPSEGSVGASGDLTPLSYIAGALVGERDVYYQGQIVPIAQVYAEKGLQPLVMRPKEGLALMNGTAVMTAIACLNYKKAEQISFASTLITAPECLGFEGNPSHFDEVLFCRNRIQDSRHIASAVTRLVNSEVQTEHQSSRLQDRYSLRCAPHVIRVFEDSKVVAASVS